MIAEYIARVQQGADCAATVRAFLAEAKKLNERYAFISSFTEDLALRQAAWVKQRIAQGEKLPLAGLPVTVKDAICVENEPSTAGSAILDGFRPVATATAIQKLINAGAIIVGKTNQDEFGFGSFGTNTGVGLLHAKNPVDPNHVCGGSSSGSGGITRKTTHPHVSIGESTGGSIVAPAAFCGVVGLCPTYGRVSRNGVIDYASSLDKLGPLAKTVKDCARVLQIMAGHDLRDETTGKVPVGDYLAATEQGVRGLRIATIKEGFGEGVSESVKNSVHENITELERQGASIREVSLPLNAKYAIPAYFTIAMSEASTNLAKYCGMRYGAHLPMKEEFDEYFAKVRTTYFGREAKRRVLLGTFTRMAGYRDAFYQKALKVRTMLIAEYAKAFGACDLLVTPTMPIEPPTFDEAVHLTPLQNYLMDVLTVGPNLAGLPHLSIPMKDSWKGIMFTGKHYDEATLLRAGGALHE